LWPLVRSGGFDAVVIYTGYMFASFWLVVLAAKSRGIPVIISIDSTTLQSRDGKRWKQWIKPWVLRKVFSCVNVIMAASDAARALAMDRGVGEERIRVIRAGADKESWVQRLRSCDRAAVRREWNIDEDALVVLFCAKLQTWKRPLDLLTAFAKVDVSNAYLVFAGDGPQRSDLEAEVRKLGLERRVRILGFVNVSRLPCIYHAADLFVLPSEYDPCPLVVTEAMFSGLPVVMSDAVLGRLEMIDQGKSGYLYPSRDVNALAAILKKVLCSSSLLEQLKIGVRRQMESWTAEVFLGCWVGAVEAGVRLKQVSQKQT
jgi:glycosyltransferase involved in cell wall biosynthesis